jgi:D-sedoheptulose 7-phosphate isomerase
MSTIINLLLEARERDNTIFLIGNGGSAATCSHFSEDLSLGTYEEGIKPFKTISLTDNTPYITALGNDIGYENAFLGQIRCLLNKDDIVIGISGSGNSLNLIKALKYANEKGATTIGLLGFDGGKMKDICSHNVIVETKRGMYGPVEDMHLILVHIICTFLMYKIKEQEAYNLK